MLTVVYLSNQIQLDCIAACWHTVFEGLQRDLSIAYCDLNPCLTGISNFSIAVAG